MSRITHCPACAAPVSARAVLCALCDHVIDADRLAAATRAADQRSSRAMRKVSPWPGIARGAARTVAILALGWGVVAVGVAGVAAHASRGRVSSADPQRAARLATLRTAWPEVERAALRAAAPARRDSLVDGAALRALNAAMVAAKARDTAERTALARAFDVDEEALARHGALLLSASGDDRAQPPRGGLVPALLRDGAPAGALPDSVRLHLAADSATPWLAVWRRAAQAGVPAGEWNYRPDVPGVAGPIAAPMPGYGAWRALAGANASAAVLEAHGRRRAERANAVLRARENVAMAHVLSRGGTVLGFLLARQQLQLSAALLAHVGRVTGDSAAVADGGALLAALAPIDGVRLDFWPTVAAADPAAPTLVAAAGDRALPPGVRAETVIGVMMGSCQRTREVLLGPAGARDESVRQVVAQLADIDPDGRLLPLLARTPGEWRAAMAGEGARELGVSEGTWDHVMRGIGLGGVAARARVCTAV